MSFDAATAELSRHTSPLQEAFGDLVPFSDYPQMDWPDGSGFTRGGLIPITSRSDREDGKFYPVYETETDLAMIRGMARRIMSMSPNMPAALTALRTYTMGNGPTVSVVPKAKGVKPDDNCKLLQRVTDRAIEQIDLAPLLEEVHDRSREEGEELTVLHQHDADCIAAEIVEMDCLTEPYGGRDLADWIRDEFGIDCDSFVPSWSFGVLTPKRATYKPLGYHVVYDGAGADFEFYPEARAVHVRRNVPKNVKRGVSDWLQGFGDLKNECKLRNNVGVGAAVQAAIAWIEEMPPGTTPGQGANVSPTDILTRVPTNIGQGGGTRSQRATHYPAGSIVRTSAGRKYQAGPMGAERNPNFEIAAQMMLRAIGIRHNLPEYMISGDASNANFASTLVAESPFVKARESDQEFMRRVTKSLLWKAVTLLWHAMTGQPGEILDRMKQHYEIKVDFPSVQSRDPLATAERLKIETECGWTSDRTAASELGRDYDDELSQGAKKAAPPMSPFGAGAMGAGQFGQQGNDQPQRGTPQPNNGLEESLSESFSEEDHPRSDNGRFITKGRLEAAKKDPAKAAELRSEVTDPGERKKLDKVIGPEKSVASAILSAPSTIAHAIDDAGTASGGNAAGVEKVLHGQGATVESLAKAATAKGWSAKQMKLKAEQAGLDPVAVRKAAADLVNSGAAKHAGQGTHQPGKTTEEGDRHSVSIEQIEPNRKEAHDAIVKAGGKLRTESASGSRYYEMPNGRQVRIADHPANEATDRWEQNNDVHEIRVDKKSWQQQLISLLHPLSESTVTAAIQGALESVASTEEAKAVLGSLMEAYP